MGRAEFIQSRPGPSAAINLNLLAEAKSLPGPRKAIEAAGLIRGPVPPEVAPTPGKSYLQAGREYSSAGDQIRAGSMAAIKVAGNRRGPTGSNIVFG